MRNTDATTTAMPAGALRDTHTHSHRHTHTNQYAYAPADRYPHTHTDDASRNDSHVHWHRTDEPHVHLGDALGLPEYWRRRVRWWLVQRLDHGPSGGRRSAMSRWWRVHLVDRFDQLVSWCRGGGSRNSGTVLDNRKDDTTAVGCRTCRSIGMVGMAMMFGIPMPCLACAVRRNG